MIKEDKKGLYIAIIGLDCTGKSSIVLDLMIKDFKMLSEKYGYDGFKVVTELNNKWNLKYLLKTCIKNQKNGSEMSNTCKKRWLKQYKQNTEYVQHLIDDNKIVISDRLWTDGFVYQGFTWGELQKANLKLPDYIFWIDKPLEDILECLEKREKEIEVFETKDMLKKHYDRFIELYKIINPLTNCYTIQNAKSKDIFKYITMNEEKIE